MDGRTVRGDLTEREDAVSRGRSAAHDGSAVHGRSTAYDSLVAREKRYVQVVSSTSPDGDVTPLVIVWNDGRRYRVSRVLDRRRAYSETTGATGLRYTVRVGRRVTYLYYEDPRWFVEARVVPLLC